MIFVETTT